MPSAATPSPAPIPSVVATLDVRFFQPLTPTLGPEYPNVGPIGLLVIVLAYFSLGVAVGAVMKQSPRAQRWLPLLIVPGLLGAAVFVAWVLRSLM